MPTVEAVSSSDLDQVLPLLRAHDPSQDDDAWERLLRPPWAPDGASAGWVLLDRDRAVGFLGAVFSTRHLAGSDRRFCNLTTWYVDAHHRESSLALLRPVMRLREHTLTDLSPNAAAARISRRLGLVDLDTGLVLVGRVGAATTRRSPTAVHVDDPEACDVLDQEARAAARDHEGLPGIHTLVAETPHGSVLVVLGRVTSGRRPYSHIHHVSDTELFSTHHAAIRRAIDSHIGGPLIIDSRFARSSTLPNTRLIREKSLKLFKPCDDLPTDKIDNLYSELVLLPFPQLPPSAGALGERISARARRAFAPARDTIRRQGTNPQ